MNTIPVSLRRLVVVAALTLGLTAAAQSSIQFFTLQKMQNFTQTGAGSGNVAASANPWTFSATIQGTSLDSSNPPTLPAVTTPATSGVTSFNLNFFPVYGWEHMVDYADQGTMDAAFKNGTYTNQMGFGTTTPFTLNLAGDYYAGNPVATLTGGTWLGGVYLLDPTSAWSLNSGTFTFNVGDVNSRMEITIVGTGVNFSMNAGVGSAHPFSGPTGSLGLTSADVGAPTFVAGSAYEVEIRFLSGTELKDIGLNVGQLAGSATGVALYDSHLSFTIQAVPEPSTYVAWAGGLAFIAAVLRHRRRRTSAD